MARSGETRAMHAGQRDFTVYPRLRESVGDIDGGTYGGSPVAPGPGRGYGRGEKLVEGLSESAEQAWEGVVRHRRIIIFVLVVLTVVFMLYKPMRDWYVAMRSSQDLKTYYAALEAQNSQIRQDLDRLQTKEGIEDEARRRGYIDPDETGVLVENLTLDEVDLSDDVVVSYDTAWNEQLLDFVFGYTPGQWQ